MADRREGAEDFRYASVRTLLAIASHLGARLEVVPEDAPWPELAATKVAHHVGV